MTKPSTPSSPPKSPKKPSGSTTLWTIPQPTDVLSYVYLWARDADAGRDEGSKERPVVVVLATQPVGTRARVTVAPVTTKTPLPSDAAIEMPAPVRRQLGWAMIGAGSSRRRRTAFLWPGPDLRPLRREGDGSPYYGKVPGDLLRRVREAYVRIGRRSCGYAAERIAEAPVLDRERSWIVTNHVNGFRWPGAGCARAGRRHALLWRDPGLAVLGGCGRVLGLGWAGCGLWGARNDAAV